MQVGLRVVRGPDWMCGDQDGGEGNVGTVVHLGGDGNVPDDTVLVYWDTGKQANYRAGSSGKYDLRVFDSAQTGLKHIHINCDGCKEVPLIGTRWKCADCENYDLCSTCFTSDVHDKQHAFLRFDQPQGDGIPVGKRTNFVKLQSKGFFPGARVTRGRDWKWGEQDGGNGRVGRLSEITAWKGVERSGAKVIWGMLRNNTYRAGHQGSVDLKCRTPGNGPSYYRECLAKVREKRQRADANRLKVGDRVSLCVEAEVLKTMSQGHGGWIDAMAKCIGKIGTISQIDDDGDVRISYGLQSWVFHPDAVTKALGKQGMILALNTDGNAVVKVGTDPQWLFNPAALEATSQQGETESPEDDSSEDDNPTFSSIEDTTCIRRVLTLDVEGASDSRSASTENEKRKRSSSSVDNQTSGERPVKEGKPKDDDLERLASELTEVWEQLGRRLEIKQSRLEAFNKENDKCSEKAYKMLLHWKQKNGRAAKYQVLYDALCDSLVSHKNLAEEYCCDR